MSTVISGIKPYILEEKPIDDSVINLNYGPAGSGKSWFAGTAGPRTFYINSGDGIVTLKSPLFRSRYPESKNMIVVDLNEVIGDEPVAYDLVCDTIDLALSPTYIDKWDTLVLDDNTSFKKFARNKAISLNAAEATDAKRKGRDLKNEFIKTEVGDYGVEMQMIEWFLGTYIPMFKFHRKHFIMTAHERHIFGKPAKIGDEAPLRNVKPGFTGKTHPDDIQGYFDNVWRHEVVGGGSNRVYRITTAGNEIYAAKSRYNGIFETVEQNLDFPKALERIKKAELHKSYLPK